MSRLPPAASCALTWTGLLLLAAVVVHVLLLLYTSAHRDPAHAPGADTATHG